MINIKSLIYHNKNQLTLNHKQNLKLPTSLKLRRTSLLRSGFTIVELLVVIVIIGILASITMIAYTGITQKAIAATLRSDLKNSSTQLEMDKAANGDYPSTDAESNGGKGLPKSTDTIYQYTAAGSNYCLSATSVNGGAMAYHISSIVGTIEEGVCNGHTAPGGGELPSSWNQLSAGAYYTCAIASDNKAYCWGYNGSGGALGNNSTVTTSVPVAVYASGLLSGKTIKSISGTCVIASDDQAYCWGSGGNGRLGNNSTVNSSIPVAVDTSGVLSGKTIKSISGGDSFHTCAIASDDQAYCWGSSSLGMLGNNSTTQSLIPVAVNTSGVLSGKTIKTIDAGYEHTCAIASDNQAYCWGLNDDGQLGNNSTGSRSIPVAVNTSGVLSGKTITAGFYYTCAIASDDQAYCWGDNRDGQLGNNSTTNSLIPVAVNTSGVLSGKTIKSITVGQYHTCAIASDNQAYCWGDNYRGQLGNNSTTTSPIPVAVSMPAPPPPPPPTITVTLNGANVQATIAPAYTCSFGTVEYGIRSRTDDGTWSAYSAWSTTTTASQTANDGVKYGYQAQARCNVGGVNYSSTATSVESIYTDPIIVPTMTVTFSAQELYVAWPGDDQTVCKEWTVPGGNTIKGFLVSQATESGYDYFIVSSDGVEKYNKSGAFTDKYVDISATPGTVLSACMVADESEQDGYGGEVTGVLYN